MELVFAVAALTALAVLALRFGVDSRPATALPGHPRERSESFDISTPERPRSEPLPIGSQLAAPFPTLAMLDRARGNEARPFAEAPNAAHLEDRARELIALYWSDTAWLTGIVPYAVFSRVCEELERAVAAPIPEPACA